MDEIKTEVIEDVSQDTSVAEEAIVSEEETAQDQKKKIKLPAWLDKIVEKIKSNEDVRQMVVFTLFSFICGGSQMIITLLLPLLLKLGGGVLTQKFYGFDLGMLKDVFGYPTTSDFIGFLVGSLVGQVLTFVLNRKKTFNCTNNIVIAIIMYIIVAVAIIFVQILLGSAILTACQNANHVEDTSFLYQVYNLTGQAVGGITALVMSFLGNKFLVMRNWGEKKSKQEACEQAECNCEECAKDACTCEECKEAACDSDAE